MERSMKDWHESFSSFVEEKGKFVFRQKKENDFVLCVEKSYLKNFSDFPPDGEVEIFVNDFSLKIKGKNPESIFAYLQKISKKN